MNYFQILAQSPEESVCQLAALVLQIYPTETVRLLSGPQRGLVMLRVRETVADSQFNAGEILVTEVKLELADQFGYGIAMGDCPRKATAIALVDAAMRTGGEVVQRLEAPLDELARRIQESYRHTHVVAARTKVDFEVF